MRIGYLECFSGISGDMLLGALVDAGVPFESLADAATALNVGARLEMRKVTRGGLTATKVDVITPDGAANETGHSHDHSHEAHPHTHSHEESGAPPFPRPFEERVGDHKSQPATVHSTHSHAPHRHLSSILKIIAAAPLSDAVKARSTRAFQLLGEAEAGIHSIPIEQVHFHEVGAVDTIVDIVCSAAGAELLNVDRWLASPLSVGSGTVKCQHGTLPVPAPATLALLGDAPVYAAGSPMERVTPTGAAVLRMLDVRYETLPAMQVKSTGYGAGGRETPGEPNLLRLLVGEAAEKAVATSPEEEPIAIIETVIDDSNPQVLAYVSELLLEAGAWDVYRMAVQMKKGRTGVQMTVLCSPDLVPALEQVLFRETTTIGLHWRLENKHSLTREWVSVTTAWGDVRIKIARWPSGEIANASPEYEDCRKAATRYAVPLKQVMQQAMQAFAADRIQKADATKESH
ncbi:MAG TPA: nickel pincer cofactor biosynthesis protein LarC [Terracidiphilus sp.]|nr:nickel pincer cofactor biosynthesis protein LarC [Terracidiphilus sp.]